MLRIRNKTWGYVLFDIWIVALSVVVTYGLITNNSTSNKANKLSQQNSFLIYKNRQLIRLINSSTKRSDRKICARINNINVLITQTLQRTKFNVSHVAYFKAHPAERKAQIKEINRELRSFKPRSCKGGR